MFWVLGHVPHARTNCRPRGVDTGNQHQVAHAQHIIERYFLAFNFGVHQLGNEVVLAWIILSIFHLSQEELNDVLSSPLAALNIGDVL